MSKNVLRVNIYGTDYTIKGDSDAKYMKTVADYVDTKMREIDSSVSSRSSLRVAILASINITDELHQERIQHEELLSNYKKQCLKITHQLDEALQKSSEILDRSALKNNSGDDDIEVKW